MKRREMVKKNQDIEEILKNKNYKSNKLFTIYKKSYPQSYPQFAITIKKNYGTAVLRNKIKRQIRNIIDTNKKRFKKDWKYIIMIKNACINKTYNELEKELTSLIKEIE